MTFADARYKKTKQPKRRPGRPRKSEGGGEGTREKILGVAQGIIQSRGYNGFSFKTVADELGLNTAAIHHHFPTKADLGAAVARRYAEGIAETLARFDEVQSDPKVRLADYAGIYRAVLEEQDRLCLCGLLGAERDTLPDEVRAEVTAFFEQQLAWITSVLDGMPGVAPGQAAPMAQAYLSLLEGAMLVCRSHGGLDWFDDTVDAFLTSLP